MKKYLFLIVFLGVFCFFCNQKVENPERCLEFGDLNYCRDFDISNSGSTLVYVKQEATGLT